MNYYALVHEGEEEICVKELQELVGASAKKSSHVISFSLPNTQLFATLLNHAQSVRRLIIALGSFTNIDEMNLKLSSSLNSILPQTFSFKVVVENVKGQENREELAKKVTSWFFLQAEKENLKPTLNLRTPNHSLILYHNGTTYFLGVDLYNEELNARSYRLFPHSASFKGDAAYYIVRKSKFEAGKKLLVSFFKDGTMLIEAAFFANKIPFRPELKQTGSITPSQEKTIVFGFDEAKPNVFATRKHLRLAKAEKYVQIEQQQLDELSSFYETHSFDNLIFHITKKDEDKINDIYNQAALLLKKGGTLLLVSRSGFEVFYPSTFSLQSKEELKRGESVLILTLLSLA